MSPYSSAKSISSLPNSNFTPPGPFDVICARGKHATNHSGNIYYRTLIQLSLEKYSKARSKYDKTTIVSEIVAEIHEVGGGFVKQQDKDNSNSNSNNSKNSTTAGIFYHQVGESFAREKIGQNLRDSLSNQYKSSAKAKRRRRGAYSSKIAMDVERIIQSNDVVLTRMDALTNSLQRYHQNNNNNNNKSLFSITNSDDSSSESSSDESESSINQLFIQTNIDILEAFKNDHALRQEFTNAERIRKQQQ